MSFFAWVKTVLSGDAPLSINVQADDEEVAGLNFRTAIDAHMKWKVRLHETIQGTSPEQLDPNHICQDDQCALGKWMYSIGGLKYSHLPEFRELKQTHAEFHCCAALIVTQVQAGERTKAMQALQHGEYAHTSEKIKAQLAKLYIKLRE